jgi:hypothetical protein
LVSNCFSHCPATCVLYVTCYSFQTAHGCTTISSFPKTCNSSPKLSSVSDSFPVVPAAQFLGLLIPSSSLIRCKLVLVYHPSLSFWETKLQRVDSAVMSLVLTFSTAPLQPPQCPVTHFPLFNHRPDYLLLDLQLMVFLKICWTLWYTHLVTTLYISLLHSQ